MNLKKLKPVNYTINFKLKSLPVLIFILLSFMGASCVVNDSKNNTNHLQDPQQTGHVSERFAHYHQGQFIIPGDSQSIETFVALTMKQQEQGLSFVKPNEMDPFQGLLFVYAQDQNLMFWMPDTFFNLDLIYLSKDLVVVDIHHNLEFFPSREPFEKIPRAKQVYARHVLEIRSDSPLAQKIKYGMKLEWKASKDLEQILSSIRPQQ